jgi:hypothetical protein
VDGATGHLVWSLELVIACGAHATDLVPSVRFCDPGGEIHALYK